MLCLKTPDEIIKSLKLDRCVNLGIPASDIDHLANIAGSEYLLYLGFFGGVEIAGDFTFLPAVKLKSHNLNAPYSELELWDKALLFAYSGTGDSWVVQNNQVFFIDHDEGESAEPKYMELDISSWLQLADLMSQFEQSVTPIGAFEVFQQLVKISPNLGVNFPYNISI